MTLEADCLHAATQQKAFEGAVLVFWRRAMVWRVSGLWILTMQF